MEIKESTEFVFNVQKDLIVFKSFAKNMKENGRLNFKKEVPDKKNIKQYLFEGYKKSYYAENAFDSDDERRLSVVLEEDSEVIRFIKPPLNQLGLFYKAAKQYNPDFLVETADKKYMIEVKAVNQTDNEDVQETATKGSQFVWVPVGTITKADGTTTTITLGRYDFNSTTGVESAYTGTYVEEDSNDSSTLKKYGNTIAKNITNFKNSVATNGGYYIGRYEARTATARNDAGNALTQITEKGTENVYNYF